LPNLIAQQNTVPEFIQEEATPQRLAEALSVSCQGYKALDIDRLDMFVTVSRELTHTSGMRPSQQAARLVMGYI
jgi:lipid A disaccharide synthetase